MSRRRQQQRQRRPIRIVQSFVVVAASVCRFASCSAESESDPFSVAVAETRQRSRNRRSLGDITARIPGPLVGLPMLWQEFRHGAASVGSAVTPCPNVDYCSSSELAQPLEENESPWTFTLSSCMVPTVVEGYHSGQAVYQVADRGLPLGNTSVGSYSEECWEDPEACKALSPSVAGQGSWLLARGNHSLTITISNLLSEYPEDVNDGGWFQLTPTSCPAAPTPPRACSTLNKGCAGTSSCCKGLTCRKTLATSGRLRCLKCIVKAKACTTTGHCCAGLRCLPVRSGSTSKVCK